MKRFLVRIVTYLETADIPFHYFILTFFAAVTLRNLFEQLVFADTDPAHMAADLFHYYLNYIFLALGFISLLQAATKENVLRVARVVLPCFIILNIVPLIDSFFRGAHPYSLGYMFPGEHDPLWLNFVTFFGPLKDTGITIGMRTEIAIVLAGCLSYFSLKGLSWLKNILFCFLIYAFVFVTGALPYIIKAVMGFLKINYSFKALLFIHMYFVLLFPLIIWVFFVYRPDYMRALVKDIRFLRVLHFELMFFIGMAAGRYYGKGIHALTQYSFFEITLTAIAIFLACVFALTTNNLADVRIDAVSNAKRPTVSGAIPMEHYRFIPWFFLLGALLYSWIVNVSALFVIGTFMSVYYLYSMPPLRLKRIPILSKGFIVLNSILLLALGYYMQDQTVRLALDVPRFFFT